jgi:hypothetical protein
MSRQRAEKRAYTSVLGRLRGGLTSKISKGFRTRCGGESVRSTSSRTASRLHPDLRGGLQFNRCRTAHRAPPRRSAQGTASGRGVGRCRFWVSLLLQGILTIITPCLNQKVPEHLKYCRYRHRNRFEPMFNKLKQQRSIATSQDKTVFSFESLPILATSRL